MKTPFGFLKREDQITLHLTRDSVCMGDDCDSPHEKLLTTHASRNAADFIRNLAAGYLPSVAGIGHTWDCVLNGVHIGTVSHTGIEILVPEIQFAENNSVHFRYNSATY